jgi:N-methylhydantoinase A/oxoprolinase/acetone carboxylase beta subunit
MVLLTFSVVSIPKACDLKKEFHSKHVRNRRNLTKKDPGRSENLRTTTIRYRKEKSNKRQQNVTFANKFSTGSRLRIADADACSEETISADTSSIKTRSSTNYHVLSHHQTSITTQQYKLTTSINLFKAKSTSESCAKEHKSFDFPSKIDSEL